MLPATVQLNLRSSSFIVNPSSNYAFPNRKLLSVERPICITNPNGLSFRPGQLIIRRNFGISASSAVAEDTSTDDSISPTPPQKQLGALQKLGVVVKPMEKPRLVLKFLWMEKNIGLAIDQVIPGYGTIPLSPYYFWPRKDAWEELKVMLESKPWISQKEMVILLNQATDIINLWQQSGGDLA